MQVNDQNFLRWYDDTPETGMPNDMPHAYWYDRDRCSYAPIGFPGEVLSFYINTPNGLVISGLFSDLRIALIDAQTDIVVVPSVATLFQHMAFLTAYNIYSNVTIPSVPFGLYYFKIYRQSTGVEVLRSSFINIKTDAQEVYNTSTYCRFRHDRFFYNIRYHDIPSFYQQFRLDMSVMETQTEVEGEPYNEVTTGQTRVVSSVMRKYRVVETYYFDEAAHDAAAVMVEHEYLRFNAKLYSKKSAYKRDNHPRSKVNKGSFEVWDNAFTGINRC